MRVGRPILCAGSRWPPRAPPLHPIHRFSPRGPHGPVTHHLPQSGVVTAPRGSITPAPRRAAATAATASTAPAPYAGCDVTLPAAPPRRSAAATVPGRPFRSPPWPPSPLYSAATIAYVAPFHRRRSASPERVFLHSIRIDGFMTR